ncbi:hypothetical protein BJX61DRAFT_488193 [Aspergillus egyptiacus]|nr:hypothetical protein BJX61DRAFT_488193 [Aspergillus egyptiacus]
MEWRAPHKPHHPFPLSLQNDCVRAAEILQSFIKTKDLLPDAPIWSRKDLHNVKGLLVVTLFRAGFLFSGRFGSGILVSRTDEGRWSSPSAVIIASGGFGGLIGFDLTDFVFFLYDDTAVKVFSRAAGVTLGCGATLALGPFGRSFEISGAISFSGASAVPAHAKTMGIMAGLSLQVDLVFENRIANTRAYGRGVRAREELRSSQTGAPANAERLMRILQSDLFTQHGEPLDDLLSQRDLEGGSNQMLEGQQEEGRQPGDQAHSGP